MAIFLENLTRIVIMLLLLACSAFFSGSETAFFNISKKQLQFFLSSKNTLHNIVAKLLVNPRNLLTSLLFGNMTVNVSFFALASVLSHNLVSTNPTAAVITALSAFLILLLFGEMLPKSLAYSNSAKFCVAAAPVCIVITRILSPILKALEFLITKPAIHLMAGSSKSPKYSQTITVSQLKLLIDSSRQKGLISTDENLLLSEVADLSLLKVRHVMQPRVDMLACDIKTPSHQAVELMRQNSRTTIPVYSNDIDNIIGILQLRSVLLNPDKTIDALLDKPHFIPEQKSIESLLQYLAKHKSELAVVVDEYGGIAGVIDLDDIIAQLIGPAEKSGENDLVTQIGPMQYRLNGALPIHDWADLFAIEPEQTRVSTIGGLTTALIGRIPKPGDTAQFKNLTFTVDEVKKNRVESVTVSLKPLTDQDNIKKNKE